MKKKQGVTLVELLLGVILILILVAIIVPNFMQASIRSKISRTHADMRMLDTAIEAYRADNNAYPVACTSGANSDSNGCVLTTNTVNCNTTLATTSGKLAVKRRSSFAVGTGLHMLTTPIAYTPIYLGDPFADTRGKREAKNIQDQQTICFGYTNCDNTGWVLWSYGPDCDESYGGQLGANVPNSGIPNFTGLNNAFGGATSWKSSTVYNPYNTGPTAMLVMSGLAYDITNGSTSGGDIFRVKQKASHWWSR